MPLLYSGIFIFRIIAIGCGSRYAESIGIRSMADHTKKTPSDQGSLPHLGASSAARGAPNIRPFWSDDEESLSKAPSGADSKLESDVDELSSEFSTSLDGDDATVTSSNESFTAGSDTTGEHKPRPLNLSFR